MSDELMSEFPALDKEQYKAFFWFYFKTLKIVAFLGVMTHLTFKIQFLLIMYNCIMYINHVRSLVKNSSVLLNTIRVRLHDIKQQQSDVNKSFQRTQ